VPRNTNKAVPSNYVVRDPPAKLRKAIAKVQASAKKVVKNGREKTAWRLIVLPFPLQFFQLTNLSRPLALTKFRLILNNNAKFDFSLYVCRQVSASLGIAEVFSSSSAVRVSPYVTNNGPVCSLCEQRVHTLEHSNLANCGWMGWDGWANRIVTIYRRITDQYVLSDAGRDVSGGWAKSFILKN
jgi:hypothetical protein